MPTSEQFRLLAALAEIAPELGLDPDALRKKADANYVETHPYSFEIWRHFVLHTERARTVGDAIDSWINLSESDECAMNGKGIFYHDKEIVSQEQLYVWSCLPFQF